MRFKKKSDLERKRNVQRLSPERSSHGKNAVFSPCLCFSEPVGGEQGDAVHKGNGHPFVGGSCQRYQCSKCRPRLVGSGSSPSQRLSKPRCGISCFHSISDSGSLCPPQKTKSAWKTLSLMLLGLPSTQGCLPALMEMTVGGNAVPKPSDLTCI